MAQALLVDNAAADLRRTPTVGTVDPNPTCTGPLLLSIAVRCPL